MIPIVPSKKRNRVRQTRFRGTRYFHNDGTGHIHVGDRSYANLEEYAHELDQNQEVRGKISLADFEAAAAETEQLRSPAASASSAPPQDPAPVPRAAPPAPVLEAPKAVFIPPPASSASALAAQNNRHESSAQRFSPSAPSLSQSPLSRSLPTSQVAMERLSPSPAVHADSKEVFIPRRNVEAASSAPRAYAPEVSTDRAASELSALTPSSKFFAAEPSLVPKPAVPAGSSSAAQGLPAAEILSQALSASVLGKGAQALAASLSELPLASLAKALQSFLQLWPVPLQNAFQGFSPSVLKAALTGSAGRLGEVDLHFPASLVFALAASNLLPSQSFAMRARLGQFSDILFGKYLSKPAAFTEGMEEALLAELGLWMMLKERHKRKRRDGKDLPKRSFREVNSKDASDFNEHSHSSSQAFDEEEACLR